MSLPARQQHVIDEIEAALRASEPHLVSMYAMFARLNQQEPVTAEPLAGTRRRRRVPGDAMFAVVLLPVMFMMIILGVLVGGARDTGSCNAGYAAGAAAAASQGACPAASKTVASTTSGGTSASCPASASAAGQAESAAQSAATARFLTRTASEQALSPPPATSDTAGVC